MQHTKIIYFIDISFRIYNSKKMEIVQKFNRGLVKWIVIYAMEYDRIIKEKSDFFSLEEDTLNCLLTVVCWANGITG